MFLWECAALWIIELPRTPCAFPSKYWLKRTLCLHSRYILDRKIHVGHCGMCSPLTVNTMKQKIQVVTIHQVIIMASGLFTELEARWRSRWPSLSQLFLLEEVICAKLSMHMPSYLTSQFWVTSIPSEMKEENDVSLGGEVCIRLGHLPQEQVH